MYCSRPVDAQWRLFKNQTEQNQECVLSCVLSQRPSCLYAVKVSSPIILGHLAAPKHSSAKYPIRRIDCKLLSVPRGFSSFNPDNSFLGYIPKRIVLGLADKDTYNGSNRANPFHFKHHNLT